MAKLSNIHYSNSFNVSLWSNWNSKDKMKYATRGSNC